MGNLPARAVAYARYVIIGTLFRPLERLGFHITPVHFYEPIPSSRELRTRSGLWENESTLPGIDMNDQGQLQLLGDMFAAFGEEWASQGQNNPISYDFYTGKSSFGLVDAKMAHCMVRHFNPGLIIEIGSGYSTLVLAQAGRLNGEKAGRAPELVSIDPYPKDDLVGGLPGLTLRRVKVEDVGLEFFSRLDSGDILFIDSSHVVRTGGDVNYLFLEVLPRLRPGVIVHVHDVFLPAEYPREWIFRLRRFWTEQYLLQAFLAFNSAFSVLWSSAYMRRHHSRELQAAFPGELGNPASFWIRRNV